MCGLLHQKRPVTGNQENKINRKKENKYLLQMAKNNELVGKMRIVYIKNIKFICLK